MADTLDYRSANVQKQPREIQTNKGPRAVIPLDFDVIAARSQDQGDINAIEYQLKREGIEVFRTHDGPAVDQWIQLLVKADDRDKAMLIATATLQRRQKMNALKRR